MTNYGVSNFETGDSITEGLQGRDGLRVARSIATDRDEPVLLWDRDGGSWRVDPDGSCVGWDADCHREIPDADGPLGACALTPPQEVPMIKLTPTQRALYAAREARWEALKDLSQEYTLRAFAAAAAATGGYVPSAFAEWINHCELGGLNALDWRSIFGRVADATDQAWRRTCDEGGGSIIPTPIQVTIRGHARMTLEYETSMRSRTVATLIRYGDRVVGELRLYRGDEMVTEGYRVDLVRAVLNTMPAPAMSDDRW